MWHSENWIYCESCSGQGNYSRKIGGGVSYFGAWRFKTYIHSFCATALTEYQFQAKISEK
jgi:hypothetical protein